MQLRHLVALSYMRDHDGCPQQELAEAFCMDANNVVLLLNELEELGYVSAPARPRRPAPPPRVADAGRAEALGRRRARAEAIEDDVLRCARRRGAGDPVASAQSRAARRRAGCRAGEEEGPHRRAARGTTERRRERADGRARRCRQSATTASISTCAPRGSAATPIAPRAGGSPCEEGAVDLVDGGELGKVGHVDRQAHRAMRVRSRPRRRPLAGSPGTAAPARRASSPTSSPVAGSSGICPEQNSSPPLRTAWL